MGLQTKLLQKFGIEKAYLRVSKDILYRPEAKEANIELLIYLNEELRKQGSAPIAIEQLIIKNELVTIEIKRKSTLEEIKANIDNSKLVKFVDVPVYETLTLQRDDYKNEGNPEGIYFAQTDKIIGTEKHQVNLSDEEILEKFNDMEIVAQKYEQFNFFDEFQAFFEEGKYIDGVYNYLKTNPNLNFEI